MASGSSPDNDRIRGSWAETVTNIAVLVVLYLFLFHYFKPELLLADTTTNGGDTVSHNLLAYHLKEGLLAKGKIIGWFPYSFAGLPLFQFYFPLLYLLTALLSFVIPFNIAFKLATVSGPFLLPLTVFFGMRSMRLRFPIPGIAAALSMFFLFYEPGFASGGTIKSALAGSFSFSFSVALLVLAFGMVYRGIEGGKNVLATGVVIASIVMSHAFGLIPLMCGCTFFLFEDIYRRRLVNTFYLARVFALGFLLSGFWSIPYLFKRQWSQVRYDFAGLDFSFDFILTPHFYIPLTAALLGIGLSLVLRRGVKAQLYILYWFLSLVLFSYVTESPLLLSRFTNVTLLFALLAAASSINAVVDRLRGSWILALIVTITVTYTVKDQTREVGPWIKWNYEGMEKKASYNQYRDLNSFLKEKDFSGRIDFEYFLYNHLGSPRVFELSPMFHGKPVMEGLLFESAITYPFFFYMQHEVSESSWWPGFPIRLPKQDFTRGMVDFRLFNVHYFVAKHAKTKKLADAEPGLVQEKDVGDMRIYRVKEPGQYVEPLTRKPILVRTDNWRSYSYSWMGADNRDVSLVYVSPGDKDAERFFSVVVDDADINRDDSGDFLVSNETMQELLAKSEPYEERECRVVETVEDDRIAFTTTCPDRPHLIKVSYFPNWKVIGAERVFLVSPTMMLVFPQGQEVELVYGTLAEDIIGNVSSVLALIFVLLGVFMPRAAPVVVCRQKLEAGERYFYDSMSRCKCLVVSPRGGKILAGAVLVMLLAGGGTIKVFRIIEQKEACRQFCDTGQIPMGDSKIFKRQDNVQLGFNYPKSREDHNFVCNGAECGEGRKEFVYVHQGNVSFDLEGRAGESHILSFVVQDNYNCRSNVISVNGHRINKIEGNGLPPRKRHFNFLISADLVTRDTVGVNIAKEKDSCYGFDVYQAELSTISCDCQ
jgi:hypothetical protein